jgi:20S proteasome alpha/beta subunit
VTVCIAALFRWNYGTLAASKYETAALVLTDRMITAGDVQYEPQQTKVAQITPRIVLVIAGDYSLHSQAIKATMQHFQSNANASPKNVATYYGTQIQTIKAREAESLYLAPLGLNSDTFLAQQREMAEHLATTLTEQMQSYRGEDVEALIIGSGGDYVQLYGVDTKGIVSCFDDVGFAAIGSGAWHARSRLMQARYTNTQRFSRIAALTYAAKKTAELAPGVGAHTDITLVLKDHVETLREDVTKELRRLYAAYLPKLAALGSEFVDEFQAYISKPSLQVADEEPKGLPGGDAQTNESSSTLAGETPREDEERPKSKVAG